MIHGVCSEYYCRCSGVLVVPEAADRLVSTETALPFALLQFNAQAL